MSDHLTERINQFFGDHEVVWATPGTDNHSSNFYGHEWINEITRDDIRNLVDCAMEAAVFEDEYADLTREEQKMLVLGRILDDLQLDRPELSVGDQILELQEIVNSNQTDPDITLETFLQEWTNIPDATINVAGNCYANGWLSEEKTREFIEWVNSYGS